MNTSTANPLSIDAFEESQIDAETFDQEAHVYVAWLYLERYERYDAISRFSHALRRLTKKLGVPEKYNETITWFFMLLIDERRNTHRDAQAKLETDWHRFRAENQDLMTSQGTLLKRYYREETLRSTRAREYFVLPDKVAATTAVET